MLRTRTRLKETHWTNVKLERSENSGRTWTTYYSGNRGWYTNYSAIKDYTHIGRFKSCGGSMVQVMKPVTQGKYTMQIFDGPLDIPTNASGTTRVRGSCYGWYSIAYAATEGRGQACLSLCSSATSADMMAKFYDHWLSCKPSMASRANMAVFLYELRDLKRMFELLPKKHFGLRDWRELLSYVNSQHLNYNFGWKPFISDIRNCWKGLSTFERRLNSFLGDQNRLLRRHRTTSSTEDLSSSNMTLGSWSYRARRYRTVTYSSTFQFSYTLPPFDYETIRWRSMLDTLGLDINPKNIWAVLPWSFVVDWFVDVSRYLSQFSNDWIEPWVYYCQGCSSRESAVDEFGEISFAQGYPYASPWFPVAQTNASYYSRIVGLPSATLTADSLSTDRIRLLASLILARLI